MPRAHRQQLTRQAAIPHASGEPHPALISEHQRRPPGAVRAGALPSRRVDAYSTRTPPTQRRARESSSSYRTSLAASNPPGRSSPWLLLSARTAASEPWFLVLSDPLVLRWILRL